ERALVDTVESAGQSVRTLLDMEDQAKFLSAGIECALPLANGLLRSCGSGHGHGNSCQQCRPAFHSVPPGPRACASAKQWASPTAPIDDGSGVQRRCEPLPNRAQLRKNVAAASRGSCSRLGPRRCTGPPLLDRLARTLERVAFA